MFNIMEILCTAVSNDWQGADITFDFYRSMFKFFIYALGRKLEFLLSSQK